MKKILLICNSGMSTGFLVKELIKLAKERKMNIYFEEATLHRFKSKISDATLVCVAPQIKYNFETIKKEADKLKINTYQIQQKEYVPIFANDLLDSITKLL